MDSGKIGYFHSITVCFPVGCTYKQAETTDNFSRIPIMQHATQKWRLSRLGKLQDRLACRTDNVRLSLPALGLLEVSHQKHCCFTARNLRLSPRVKEGRRQYSQETPGKDRAIQHQFALQDRRHWFHKLFIILPIYSVTGTIPVTNSVGTFVPDDGYIRFPKCILTFW